MITSLLEDRRTEEDIERRMTQLATHDRLLARVAPQDHYAFVQAWKPPRNIRACERHLAALEQALAVALAPPPPAPPPSDYEVLAGALTRHEPEDGPAAIQLRVAALNTVLGKLRSVTDIHERALLIAAGLGLVGTDDPKVIIGQLAPIRTLMTKVDPAWLNAVCTTTGVLITAPVDQKRRAVIEILDRSLIGLGADRAWMPIYWTLELRRHLADSALVEGLPDAVFAAEVWTELVGRSLGDISKVTETKPVIATTTRVRTKLVEKGG